MQRAASLMHGPGEAVQRVEIWMLAPWLHEEELGFGEVEL